jgi:hypothetical protein
LSKLSLNDCLVKQGQHCNAANDQQASFSSIWTDPRERVALLEGPEMRRTTYLSCYECRPAP